MYVRTKDLPECIQSVLKNVSYGSQDIEVIGQETVSIQGFAGSGRRSFAALLDLVSGQYEIHYGSWGGPNPFETHKPVNSDSEDHRIPLNGAVIKGTSGNSTFAVLYLNPDNILKVLERPAEEKNLLSERELAVVYAHRAFKSSYRKEALARVGIREPELSGIIARLVELRLISQNKAGSTAITTDGKNAISQFKYQGPMGIG